MKDLKDYLVIMEQAYVLAALRILFCSGDFLGLKNKGLVGQPIILSTHFYNQYLLKVCDVPMTAAGCLQIVQEPHYHTEISPYFRSPRVLPSLEGSLEYRRLQALKS